MRVVPWAALAVAPLLFLAGCTELFGPGAESIAGFYWLLSVDGQSLPCCASQDSTGGTSTVVDGELYLGEAAPESYSYTPAGIALPVSCVHEIPNGASVDTAAVVHLPDGSSYRLPPCGAGTYRLVLRRRSLLADGSTRTESDSTSGRYSWSTPMGDTRLITLVASRMGGTVELSSGGATIVVARQHVGPPDPTRREPEYRFVPGGQI